MHNIMHNVDSRVGDGYVSSYEGSSDEVSSDELNRNKRFCGDKCGGRAVWDGRFRRLRHLDLVVILGFVLLLAAACAPSEAPAQAPLPPAEPETPTEVSALVSNGEVVLEWAASDDGALEAYRVYRGLEEGLDVRNVNPLESVAVSQTRYVDAAVESGTTYYYAVTAVNTAGMESAPSRVVSARPGEGQNEGVFTRILWSTAAEAPFAVTEAQGAAVDGELFVFGGYTSFAPFIATTAAYAYNPATDSWRRLADVPKPITHAGAVVDGRDIYLAGAYISPNDPDLAWEDIVDGSREVFRYNIDEDAWYLEEAMFLPQARGSGGFVKLGRELHFFGGHDQQRVDQADHWALSLDDPEGGWRLLPAAFPNPRNHMGFVVLDEKIYAVGGQYGMRENLTTVDLVHSFDPESGVWQAEPSLLVPLSHHTAATLVVDGRILLMGGEVTHNGHVNYVFAYDPLTQRWEGLSPLPQLVSAGVGGEVDGVLVYSGGGNFSRTTYVGEPLRQTSALGGAGE